jgi:cytochrome c oxidase subunit 2
VGEQTPLRGSQRHAGRPARKALRLAGLAVVLVSVVVLTGCSEQTRHEWQNLAMPDPASEQGEHIFTLWRWAWVAALITGGIVWGLMFWAMWRYHRKDGDPEFPVQTRYNLPLEIFYTIAPVVMVIVFFVHTVDTQNAVLDDEGEPDHTIYVVGQQWQWTFNYVDEPAVDSPNLWEAGTASYIPTLVLPVGETTEFQLRSPDVIHDFGVPGFLMKMDVIPGRHNHYRITPTVVGDFRGNCYELCGVYHSRMIFNVKVVSPEDFDIYLQGLEDSGHVSDEPLIGGSNASTQTGLLDLEEEGAE